MMPFGCRNLTIVFILLVALATCYCTSKNYLVVRYQLPSETLTAEDTRVSLIFKDQRAEQAVVTQSAKMALKNFEGNFALVVAGDNKNERLMGAFSLCSMMRTIFKQRFENAGIRVAPDTETQPIAIEVILKEFKLDLVKRKWVVQITYQVNLLRQNRFEGGQTISGSAERLQVVGGKDAEKVIGELITDAVNRLNLDELFQSAPPTARHCVEAII